MSRHLDKYTIFKSTYQFFSKEEFNKLFPNIRNAKLKLNLNQLPIIKK